MTHLKSAARYGLAILLIAGLGVSLAQAQTSARLTATQLANHEEMNELGLKYKTAWDLFQALKQQAHGGTPITDTTEPDWSGIYVRTKGGTAFDPDGPRQGLYPSTAHFIPSVAAKLRQTVANRKAGVEYDPLSQCNPPTYPRWLDLPFMKEFIVTPHETWMIAEAFNSIRRVYTDGRGHLPAADAFPTEDGDSIGFWDGDRLIVHTNSSEGMMYERAQGWYTDNVEGVEIWHKVDGKTLVANTWIYDTNLSQPWYTRQSYTKLHDPDKTIRINNWYCHGSPNNNVYQTADGGSQFTKFTWEKSKDKGNSSSTPAAGADQEKSK